MNKIKLISTFVFLTKFFLSPAQSVQDSVYIAIPSSIDAADIASKQVFINSVLNQYFEQGYITAFAQPVSDTRYLILKNKNYSNSVCILSHNDSTFPLSNYYNYKTNVINDLESQGFPFASVTATFEKQMADTFYFKITLNYGENWRYDSMAFSNFSISPILLKWMAKVDENTIFSNQANNQLLNKLAAIEGFYVTNSNPQFFYANNKRTTLQPATLKSKDFISGIIGLNTTPQGTRNLTGELEAKFNNIANMGSLLYFQWKSFQARSQQLKSHVLIPYLLGSPFIIKVNILLDKYDTLYTNATRSLTLKFPFSKNFSISATATKTTRSRISINENLVKITKQLPSNPASINNLYGISLNYLTGSPGLLSTNQLHIELNAAAGTRTFVQDAKVAQIYWVNNMGIPENIYDSLKRINQFSSSQYNMLASINLIKPISKLIVMRLFAHSNLLYLPNYYFNELSRYGGINSLIGFNEQSIFANKFTSCGLETRLMLNASGYIGLIYNGAYAINQSKYAPGKQWLHGFGLSSLIETKAGFLQIAWAVGSGAGNTVGLNQSKFHFGLLSNLGK